MLDADENYPLGKQLGITYVLYAWIRLWRSHGLIIDKLNCKVILELMPL